MYFFNVFKSTLRNLSLNKSRSFLTMLGIIIGVGSVIAIMAVGASAEDLLLSQFKAMGSNIIGIMPGASDEAGPPAAVFGIEVTTLKYEDSQALEKLPHIMAVCPYISGQATIRFSSKNKEINYTGITPAYLEVEETKVGKGRFFRPDEIDGLARVTVLGSQIERDLFGGDSALDQRVKIGQVSFKVIGVMKERGVVAFQDNDEMVFIPLKTAQKILLGVDHLAFIRAKVDRPENINAAVSQIKEVLRYRHNIKDPAKDDFSVRDTAQALEILGTVTQAVKLFLAAVAAISLLVGGVGIMNIIFVSVNERTQEIGLRKALGAKNRDILIQFLMESVVMALLGGIVGIILGVLLAWLISLGVKYFGYDWRFMVTFWSVTASVFTAFSVGVVFGIWPAWRASKLEPIKALRYE